MILFYTIPGAAIKTDQLRIRDSVFFYFFPERRHGRTRRQG
jgi:hypothetical protein